jgi:hypothetical protein
MQLAEIAFIRIIKKDFYLAGKAVEDLLVILRPAAEKIFERRVRLVFSLHIKTGFNLFMFYLFLNIRVIPSAKI